MAHATKTPSPTFELGDAIRVAGYQGFIDMISEKTAEVGILTTDGNKIAWFPVRETILVQRFSAMDDRLKNHLRNMIDNLR